MQYTDKQIEEVVGAHIEKGNGMKHSDLVKLAMRLFREEYRANTEPPGLLKLPEFWKEPEEAPKETRFGGVDVSNGPLTAEKQVQGWQPLKTIPSNCRLGHSVFIAHTSFCTSGISAFYEQGRWRDANSGAPIAWSPTHWMPIPPLPEDK